LGYETFAPKENDLSLANRGFGEGSGSRFELLEESRMKIAAGILLIIVAIINGIAGSGYALAGAVGAAATEINAAVEKEAAKNAEAAGTTEADKAAAEAVKNTQDALKTMDTAGMGAGMKYFGFFLLILAVMQFVASIMTFMSKGAMFLMAIAVLTVAGEVGGVVMSSFGVMNVVGLVAGGLLFVAAMNMKKAAA